MLARRWYFHTKRMLLNSDLTWSFRRSSDVPSNCHSSRRETSNRYVNLPTWKIFIAADGVQSPLRPIVRIVRRNEIACAGMVAFRCAPCRVRCAATFDQVWDIIQREVKRSQKLRFDPGKLMWPEISHSVVLTAHLPTKCACRYPCILECNDMQWLCIYIGLGNHVHVSISISISWCRMTFSIRIAKLYFYISHSNLFSYAK